MSGRAISCRCKVNEGVRKPGVNATSVHGRQGGIGRPGRDAKIERRVGEGQRVWGATGLYQGLTSEG
jgi:hypothetical protein